MNESEKIQILIECLKERSNSLHLIRERVQSICLWSLGILLAASGWVIQSDIIISLKGKLIFSAALLASFCILRFFYLSDLAKGFKSQQLILAKTETALKILKDTKLPIGLKELAWVKAGSIYKPKTCNKL